MASSFKLQAHNREWFEIPISKHTKGSNVTQHVKHVHGAHVLLPHTCVVPREREASKRGWDKQGDPSQESKQRPETEIPRDSGTGSKIRNDKDLGKVSCMGGE